MDAGLDDPGWVRLPGLRDDCSIERAEHPERVVTAAWGPCGDAADPSCRVLLAAATTVAGFVDPTGRYLVLSLLDARGEPTLALTPLEGPAIGAWHTLDLHGLDRCSLGTVSVGGGRAGFTVESRTRTDPAQDAEYVWIAPIGEIGTDIEARLVMHAGQGIERLVISETHFATQFTPSGLLQLWSEAPATVAFRSARFRGTPQQLHLFGDRLMVEYWFAFEAIQIATGTMTDEPAVLYGIPPDDIRDFSTDGIDMAWQQAYWDAGGSRYTRVELWTAPYVTTASAVTAHQVATMPNFVLATSGGGWYAWESLEPDRGLDVVSLADGQRRHWTPPPLYALLGAPLYATGDEILVPCYGTRGCRIDPRLLPLVP